MNADEQKYFGVLYELIAERADNYERAVIRQEAVWAGFVPDEQPLLLRCGLPDELQKKFPSYNPGEVHYDLTKMLLEGMKGMLGSALAGMHAVPSARANMGCGIFPSMFPGVMPRLFDDGKMPWVVEHLERDAVAALSYEDIRVTDEFKWALEHTEYIACMITGTGAYVYPPDVQGPFDIAHIVYGDRIFYDLYDEPDLVHHLLDLSCRAIELGFAEALKLIPDSSARIAHYCDTVLPRSLGGIKLSEDTSTIISAEHIDEFVMPYTRRILDYAGGGYIHWCGRNDHLLSRVLETENVRGINFGNPDKHDMDEVLGRIAESGKVYYGSVPKNDGEDLAGYFGRIKRAATRGGRAWLLPTYYAEHSALNEIKEAWARSFE